MKRPLPDRRAFSLVEIIVAMAILAIVGLLIFSVINNTSTIISRTSSELDANRVARECLDLIGQDLSLIRLPYASAAVNTALPAGNDGGLQLVVASSSVPSKYSHPHSFFWQASLARNKRYGDLAIVGYFVLHDLSDPDHKRLQLRRLFVEPDAPDTPDADSEYLIYRTPDQWLSASLLERFAPDSAAVDNANGQRGWVADGVLGLWVRSLDPNGNPIIADAGGTIMNTLFDSRRSYRYNLNGTVYPTGKKTAPSKDAPGYTPMAAVPAFIDVGIVCVAPRDIANIETLPNATVSNPSQPFLQALEQYAQNVRTANPRAKTVEVFTRRYRLYPTQ